MDPFLSEDALERLTGYKRAGQQAEWLKAHGYYYEINSKGKVIVPWGADKKERRPELGTVE